MIRGDRIGGKVSQGGGGPNENNFMSGSKNPFWSNVFFSSQINPAAIETK